MRDVGSVLKPKAEEDGRLSIDVYTDTDNQGCAETRRSTTGVVVLLGGAVVYTLSQTQPGLPCLSSAESELRGINKGATEAFYMQHLCEEIGLRVMTPKIWADAAAALALTQRLGTGRLKH
eukprot:968864-Lingulodinium_polyedra.AAC.1